MWGDRRVKEISLGICLIGCDVCPPHNCLPVGSFARSRLNRLPVFSTECCNEECGKHRLDRKSTRLNSSHVAISYAVFCLKKKKHQIVKWKSRFRIRRKKT